MGLFRHRYQFWFVPLQPFPGFDAQFQFQLTVNPVDAFVVPFVTLHVASIQKVYTTAPVMLVGRQAF